jgi:uncharacterized damage-inducible protein DinB
LIDRLFIDYSIQKLGQASGIIGACLEKLTEEQVWAKGSGNENAIGNLVLHLCGNIRQWLISGVDGAANTRDRDAEFAASGGVTIAELRAILQQTVDQGTAVIRAQTEATLARRIAVQNYDISILEAIYHVVEHFAGHAGQIIFATKMLTGEDLGFYHHLKFRAHAERTP